jgi:TRAP-type C4-dicarboxylate transport system permease small subunit
VSASTLYFIASLLCIYVGYAVVEEEWEEDYPLLDTREKRMAVAAVTGLLWLPVLAMVAYRIARHGRHW